MHKRKTLQALSAQRALMICAPSERRSVKTPVKVSGQGFRILTSWLFLVGQAPKSSAVFRRLVSAV